MASNLVRVEAEAGIFLGAERRLLQAIRPRHRVSVLVPPSCTFLGGDLRPQRIVALGLLCRLQYPVPILSRLQTVLLLKRLHFLRLKGLGRHTFPYANQGALADVRIWHSSAWAQNTQGSIGAALGKAG
jgi:hypothetical protein